MAAYLSDNNKTQSKAASKRASTFGVLVAFLLFCIWAYSPVSERANYKLETQSISNPIIRTASQTTQPDDFTPPDHTKNTLIAAIRKQNSPPLTSQAISLAKISKHPAKETFALQHPELEPVRLAPGHSETYEIKSGDTLTKIFADAKLPISRAIQLAKTKAASQLNSLAVGHAMRIYFDKNKQWETLEYDIDKLTTLIITPTNENFDVSTHTKHVEYRQFTAQGVIKSSLGNAAEVAGMPAKLAYSLIDIYKWEFDFARDLHKNDTFSAVYQKAFIDDEYVDSGPILAASFTVNGRTIEAVRYTDSQGITGYFQPDGESLRRGFLRTPVRLARVTSGFGKRRHPIKKTWKQHQGVDYGAKHGTPVLSTADGIIQYAGTKGGYGKTIILRHGGIYTTLYAHLSNLGKGIRTGKAVQQGQVIGYVGHSGWATGDHLHYEFRVNGEHKNPLKVKLPKTLPLAKKEIPSFSTQSEPLLATLSMMKGTHFARNQMDEKKQKNY